MSYDNTSYATDAETDLDVASGPALTPQISGIVGLCITSFLFVIASWRLLYHYYACGHSRCCHRPENVDDKNNSSNSTSNNNISGLTTKRILHGLLFTFTLVEIIGYASMVSTNTSNKLNYTLLDIIGRGILEFSTFVIGTIHWFNVISASQSDKSLSTVLYPVILAVITIGVTVCSTFEAAALLGGGYDNVDEFREHSKIHRISLIVESVGYFIHAIIVAICSKMVYKRISSLPTFSQVRSTAKRQIINKMMIPMIFCSLSYALRSGFMAADFASRIISPDRIFEAGLGWWIGNCWIPTFIPSIMLLYSIRKRDKEESGYASVAPLSSPLIHQSSHDIGNPFESFQQTFRDFEDEDSTKGNSTHDSSLPSR